MRGEIVKVQRHQKVQYDKLDPPINFRIGGWVISFREAVLTTGCEGDLKQNQSCHVNPAARSQSTTRHGICHFTLLCREGTYVMLM